jgi:hypothetical protein
MRRILLVLSVAALMAVMLAATAGTALAQVERGECLPGIPCRQGVLLPDEPKTGQTFEGEGGFVGGQASLSCPGYENAVQHRAERSFEFGGKGPENLTIPFVHCFEGPEPIE